MILQPYEQTFVEDEETGFYKYIVDENYETQGTKLLCEFTETAEDIKARVAKTLNIPSDKQFDLIEVQRCQNSFLQFLNPFSRMSLEKSARDNEMTHLSTWMVSVDQPGLSDILAANSGKTTLPISLKLVYAGNDTKKNVYSNMTVKELMLEASTIS